MINKKKFPIIAFFLALIILGIFIYGANRALKVTTYTEYQNLSGKSDGYVTMKNPSDELAQIFITPYDLVNKVAIKIGTFSRRNNSLWTLEISRLSDGKRLIKRNFNAAEIQDNSYHIISFHRNIRLDKGMPYCLRVYSKNVKPSTGLAFYTTLETGENMSALSVNNKDVKNALCLQIYGCDVDYFWLRLYIFCWIIAAIIAFFIFKSHKEGINPLKNQIVQSMILFAVIFGMLCAFSNGSPFGDESDNIQGGIIIAHGGILYKNYVTQHTPVGYYLCSLFAIIGAGSIQQFRICYYAFLALIFSLLFYRHASYWGKQRLLLLPTCIIMSVMIFDFTGRGKGYQILADSIQGLCMLSLCMEFLRYYVDRKITWARSLIVSACFWGSLGSAFVSIYALAVIGIAVMTLEILDWRQGKYSFSLTTILNRYGKLITALFIPFICAVAYFKYYGALRFAYDMAYRFNREIYPRYMKGYGLNVVQPFFLGIEHYFDLIIDSFNSFFSSMSMSNNLRLIITVLSSVFTLKLLIQKKYFLGSILFLFMCCNMTRGYNFHGFPFWYVAIALIVFFWPRNNSDSNGKIRKRISSIIGYLLIICFFFPYAKNSYDCLTKMQNPISPIEQYVVSITKDNEPIFIDMLTCNSIYLSYKKRYPINRLICFLPWYVKWYEKWDIEDLITNKPRVLIYNPDFKVGSEKNYTAAFRKVAEENYMRISENPKDGWKYWVWTRKGQY